MNLPLSVRHPLTETLYALPRFSVLCDSCSLLLMLLWHIQTYYDDLICRNSPVHWVTLYRQPDVLKCSPPHSAGPLPVDPGWREQQICPFPSTTRPPSTRPPRTTTINTEEARPSREQRQWTRSLRRRDTSTCPSRGSKEPRPPSPRGEEKFVSLYEARQGSLSYSDCTTIVVCCIMTFCWQSHRAFCRIF
jgi:hypothetical protein